MRESWASARYDFAMRLLAADPTYVGEWQSQKGVDAANTTYEILNASFEMPMPFYPDVAARQVGANLPWAEDHFQERVSGEPLNPPPSNAWWPFAQSGNAMHKAEEKFSHTYPERYWPKFANIEGTTDKGRQIFVPHVGVRFEYGDLRNVVELLAKSPYTRQAYLPVWFPEDTGSASGQRVPCTLGYQFLIRDTADGKRLHITYLMRSCDFIRHLADDIYMTIRLAQWMRDRLVEMDAAKFRDLSLGKLHFHAGSLHIFEADRIPLSRMVRDMTTEYSQRLSRYASGSGSPSDE
ncbi:thymidylate synthase [Streptomyces phage Zuko]|uniref:Thymidylate synthase n=1 Tax=Streptomyces phage Zuko TaxID=2601695 RepID=A0A5J6D767_9CAUD|nr:thymidylate synthase [Streptomyces phage Zuko]QEQ93654.1 thymidylate synthase [Streptomyces phage Zuko]